MTEELKSKCKCDLENVRNNMPNDEEIGLLADLFTVLGDNTRAKIVAALRISELCVGDIANLLSLSDSAVSHQLRLLRQSNIVKSRRDGKFVYYSLADEHVVEIYDVGKIHIAHK